MRDDLARDKRAGVNTEPSRAARKSAPKGGRPSLAGPGETPRAARLAPGGANGVHGPPFIYRDRPPFPVPGRTSMAVDANLLRMFSYYRDAEIRGATLLLRLIQRIDDP